MHRRTHTHRHTHRHKHTHVYAHASSSSKWLPSSESLKWLPSMTFSCTNSQHTSAQLYIPVILCNYHNMHFCHLSTVFVSQSAPTRKVMHVSGMPLIPTKHSRASNGHVCITPLPQVESYHTGTTATMSSVRGANWARVYTVNSWALFLENDHHCRSWNLRL